MSLDHGMSPIDSLFHTVIYRLRLAIQIREYNMWLVSILNELNNIIPGPVLSGIQHGVSNPINGSPYQSISINQFIILIIDNNQ